MFRVPKILFLFVLIIFSSAFAFGQDLGNSGGLSGSSKNKPKTSAATTTKKSAAIKPKSSVATRKTTPKTNVAANKPAQKPVRRETIAKNKPQIASKQKTKTEKMERSVVITPAKTVSDVYDERLESAIDEGNAARDERDYGRAETAYRRAQSIRASDARAVYGLGNVYSDQQRWEEAEKAYREAIRLDSDSHYAYIALSYVLVQPIFGTDLLDRYAEAERLARRAIQLDAQNPYAHDQLGVALELRGIISQETENAYRKAIQIDPTSALAYAHLGRLLRRKGLTDKSQQAYAQAIQFATDVPTMILVAEVMQSQQRYSESEQLLRRALRDDPKNPTALFLLGRALTTGENFDEAETVLKKSLLVSPNNFNGYVLLGSLYARKGNLGEAERALFKALQVVAPSEKKRLALEFETLGDGWMRAGKRRDAARVYQQAAALDAGKTTLADKLARAKG